MPNKSSTAPVHRRQESLPKLNLPNGHELTLGINYVGTESQQKITGRFVGAEDYSFVIGLFPSLVLSITSFYPKTPITISYFLEGSQYRFHAEVIAHNNVPAPLLYFTYPDRLSITDLRQAQRVDCSIPCSIFCQHGEANALISDLSSNGCRLIIPLMGNTSIREVSLEDDLVINCSFSSNKTFITPGTVKSVFSKGPFITFGVKFSEVNSFTEEAQKFIRFLTSVNNYLSSTQTDYTQ